MLLPCQRLLVWFVVLLAVGLKTGALLAWNNNARSITALQCSQIEVFDSVFDTESCSLIDEELTVGGRGHTIYLRTAENVIPQPRSMAEHAIEAVLQRLNDNSPCAEYWWRDEWMNLEVHRDLDENLWKENHTFRTPKNGHVLYLKVGEQVRGPTILLHDKEEHAEDRKDNQCSQFDKITLVPAVTGRLLRFNGI